MSYHFRNLIFEGGGVKGIAYVGALEVLDKRRILSNIQRVGGTSAGAINAVLVALDYSGEETFRILDDMNFKSFMDDSWGLVRDAKRLVDEFGWYKGDFFHTWMGQLIKAKTGNEFSTFNDLRAAGYKDLYLAVTNLSTGYSEVCSAEHTPRMRVADAARMSMSIPLFFRAIRNARRDVYVDGGVLRNYPVKLFDREKYLERKRKHAVVTEYYQEANEEKPKTSSPYRYNKETLGFRLDNKQEIAMFRDGAEAPVRDIDDFFDYSKALIGSLMSVQNDVHLHSDDWQRTVYIDTLGVGTTDFDLDDTKKQALVAAGKAGVEAYFKWYDNTSGDQLPNNHPEFKRKT